MAITRTGIDCPVSDRISDAIGDSKMLILHCCEGVIEQNSCFHGTNCRMGDIGQ